MASKVVDITEKMSFDENPKIKVKNEEYEVNADASTMLKLMGILGENGEPGPKEVISMYEMIFGEKDRKKIEKLKLSFGDFQTIIYAAINLITGDTEPGEQ